MSLLVKEEEVLHGDWVDNACRYWEGGHKKEVQPVQAVEVASLEVVHILRRCLAFQYARGNNRPRG